MPLKFKTVSFVQLSVFVNIFKNKSKAIFHSLSFSLRYNGKCDVSK